jgi:hypothetical protein
MEAQEKCLLCNALKEKFVYDADAGEVICSACGLVLDQYDGPIQASEFEESNAFRDMIFGLGNPADDAVFLKFLRKEEMKNG